MAYTAAEEADGERHQTIRSLEAAPVIAVDRQGGGMPTGTCELMELEE